MANAVIRLRGDDAADWTTANPVLALRELGLELDTGQMKVGDGVASWTSLAYFGGAGAASWGSITGTLSAQTDLQAAFDGKSAAAHGHIIGDVAGLQAALDGKQAAGSYQPLATVLTNTTAAFNTAQETKLAGVAPGATANATDSALRDRATHTGTQAAATITGLAAVATSGAYSDLTGIPATFTPATHGHVIADVIGLQTALDGKQPLATVLTNTTASFTTAQETKLAGIGAGATVTSVSGTGTVSGLTLSGTVTSSGNLTLGGTLSTTSAALTDFNSASRAETESALVAGANITITPSGSGATRQLTIAASGGGGATIPQIQARAFLRC